MPRLLSASVLFLLAGEHRACASANRGDCLLCFRIGRERSEADSQDVCACVCAPAHCYVFGAHTNAGMHSTHVSFAFCWRCRAAGTLAQIASHAARKRSLPQIRWAKDRTMTRRGFAFFLVSSAVNISMRIRCRKGGPMIGAIAGAPA